MLNTVDMLLVEIPKAIEDEIIISDGLKLYFDASYSPEWNVCTVGMARVIPDTLPNIKEGDEVAISYFVVADRTYPDYSDSFFPVMEESPFQGKWKNGKGQWLTRIVMPTPTKILVHCALLQDDRMNLIYGVDGSESDVSRWLSQFSFQDTGKYTHTNQIQVGEKIFWKVEDFNIFAKRIGDEIVSVSDRVILEPIEVDLTTRYMLQGLLEKPDDTVKGMYTDRGVVISGGESMGLKKGDIAGFEPKYCERYKIWGKECFLLKESRIDVIWHHEKNFSNN